VGDYAFILAGQRLIRLDLANTDTDDNGLSLGQALFTTNHVDNFDIGHYQGNVYVTTNDPAVASNTTNGVHFVDAITMAASDFTATTGRARYAVAVDDELIVGRSGTTTDVIKIDLSTGDISDTFAIASVTQPIIYAFGSVWASRREFGEYVSVRRFDPDTGSVTATITTTEGFIPAANRIYLAATSTHVYVATDTERLIKIDPDTDTVVSTINVGTAISGSGASGTRSLETMVVNGTDIWCAQPAGYGNVVRVDTTTDTLTTISIGYGSEGVYYYDGNLYATGVSGTNVSRLSKIDVSSSTVTETWDFQDSRGGAVAGFGRMIIANLPITSGIFVGAVVF